MVRCVRTNVGINLTRVSQTVVCGPLHGVRGDCTLVRDNRVKVLNIYIVKYVHFVG